MNNYYKKIIVFGGICSILLLSGCGKEKVTMITAERTTESSTQSGYIEGDSPYIDGSYQVTEASTEEASEEDRAITLEDISYANRGDILLMDRDGYSATTVYYSSGTEIYEETEYIGFDEDGEYFQGYENSEGSAELLDVENQCWYELKGNELTILIYPEDGVADVMIDIAHNGVVYHLPTNDEEEIITDVYRENGHLIVMTQYTTGLTDTYRRKFVLDDQYRILEIYCYDEEEELYSHTRTTENSVFNIPDDIANVITSTRKRTVSVVYTLQDGVGNEYQLPAAYEISIKLYNKKAYSDAQCSEVWDSRNALVGEYYVDEVIYLAD
ncbi:MAG: hypothetical protein ACI4D8_05950 [Wujia sp.]